MDGARYFVGIGGQKCGTTWLAKQLFAHPQVHSNPMKEMHVFDALHVPEIGVRVPRLLLASIEGLEQKRKELAGDDEAPFTEDYLRRQIEARREVVDLIAHGPAELHERYRNYFANRVRPEHQVFGEVTPGYALLPPEGFADILHCFPDARFVFLMRDPIDRLISAVGHGARVKGGRDPRKLFSKYIHLPHQVDRSRYELTLDTLNRVVPAEQQLNLFYEDLFDHRNDRIIGEIADFLGLPSFTADRGVVSNPGTPRAERSRQLVKAAQLFAPSYDAVRERMGRLPDRWEEHAEFAASVAAP